MHTPINAAVWQLEMLVQSLITVITTVITTVVRLEVYDADDDDFAFVQSFPAVTPLGALTRPCIYTLCNSSICLHIILHIILLSWALLSPVFWRDIRSATSHAKLYWQASTALSHCCNRACYTLSAMLTSDLNLLCSLKISIQNI